MTDKDRVFSRLQKERPSPADRHEQRMIPRKGNASGSRVVEVVLLRSGGMAKADREEPRARHAPGLRAAAWEGGFPARSAVRQAAAVDAGASAGAAEPAVPAVHVMPMWGHRASGEEEQEPAAERAAARVAAGTPRPQRDGAKRRIADPFDAHDTGANCLRCGYMIEPDRDRRGLMTCAACA